MHLVDLGAGEVEDEPPFRIFDLVAVELLQQRGQGGGDRVDHVHLQCLTRGQVGRLRDGEHGPVRIAMVLGGERLQ